MQGVRPQSRSGHIEAIAEARAAVWAGRGSGSSPATAKEEDRGLRPFPPLQEHGRRVSPSTPAAAWLTGCRGERPAAPMCVGRARSKKKKISRPPRDERVIDASKHGRGRDLTGATRTARARIEGEEGRRGPRIRCRARERDRRRELRRRAQWVHDLRQIRRDAGQETGRHNRPTAKRDKQELAGATAFGAREEDTAGNAFLRCLRAAARSDARGGH